jgi:serine/threonine protein kinase
MLSWSMERCYRTNCHKRFESRVEVVEIDELDFGNTSERGQRITNPSAHQCTFQSFDSLDSSNQFTSRAVILIHQLFKGCLRRIILFSPDFISGIPMAFPLLLSLFLFQLAPFASSLVRIPYIERHLPIANFQRQPLRSPSRIYGWFTTKDEDVSTSAITSTTIRKIQPRPATFQIRTVGSVIGSGSYGTVHCISVEGEGGTTTTLIGKRPWTMPELQEQYQNSADNVVNKDELGNVKNKASRCQYYFTVEKHCLTKMMQEDAVSFGVPLFRGTAVDSESREWMLFDPLYAPNRADCPSELAMSLQELIELDRMRTEQLNDEEKVIEDRQFDHHLYYTSQALLGSHTDHSLVATLDVLMEQLLKILQHIHSYSIVHRDVKPANLLITEQGQLVLIDFGSAGDLSTAGLLNQNIGLDMNRVAISPIYAAPEVFLDSSGSGSKYAANFDCFSVALLFCQLLFQYLDERTESGFHQQLANQNVPWDLDSWLQSALQSKVRPSGLLNALQVLKERPGLWKLLQDMLLPNPSDRLSSTEALQRWNKILKHAKISVQSESSTLLDVEQEDPDVYDGAFLLDVLESLEACEIPTIRPLHFVTSFDRSTSLGLFLSEVESVNVDEMDSSTREQWLAATADALPGEVFIQEIIPGGQADKIGVFAVGDRLLGVGELPLAGGGFVRATELVSEVL